MSNNEMIAVVGIVVRQSSMTSAKDYFNFFPTNKIVNGKIEKLEDVEKKLFENIYHRTNVDCETANVNDDHIKNRIEEFKDILVKNKRAVCIFHLHEKDIKDYQSNAGHNGKRIFLSELFGYKENEAIFNGFVKVITNNLIDDRGLLVEDFTESDSEVQVNTKDIELKDGDQYFIQRRNSDGSYKYVGPIGCVNGEVKKPLKYPRKLITIIESEAVKDDAGNYYIYYTGEGFDFDYKPIVEDKGKIVIEEDPIEVKRRELIGDIKEYRSYDDNMICNMLICISQGFLTVFSGEPGTGKTSICDKIAQLMGVSRKNDSSANRYLSISVERGWTSKNDLVGYLNPLASGDNAVIDVTGLYGALEKVSKEKEENATPYLVLLDEANLSQMEYYWSTFIKLADDDARRKTALHFGSGLDFMIPDWFKFLATINNDQTTESLSPRLLDRAWVISLPELDILGDSNHLDNDCERISWDEMQKMFKGVPEASPLFVATNDRVKEIYDIFKDNDKPVSPRSKNAIKAYLKSALFCFEGEDEQKTNNAIDFIILQRLLPMLNGYISNEFKEKLKAIFDIKTYPLSAKKFEKMCQQEDYTNSSYVNFFM